MIDERTFCCPLSGNPCTDPRCSEEDCIAERDQKTPTYRAKSKSLWQALLDRLGLK